VEVVGESQLGQQGGELGIRGGGKDCRKQVVLGVGADVADAHREKGEGEASASVQKTI